ncbi:MAG: alpha/beta hydrolase [Bacteroidota bacterium]
MILAFNKEYPDRKLRQWDAKYQAAFNAGDQARLELALSLADAEYHHPECERARTGSDQRSFCFHHQRITPQSFLLIHGFTACPYEMRELGEGLYRQGHNVFGVRLAGHGTTVDDFAKAGATDWKKSAEQGLEISSLLGNQVLVIGESMGGALAAILGRDFPERLAKLVLCAPAFRFVNRMAVLTRWSPIRKLIPQNDMGIKYDWQRPYWYGVIPTSAVAELVKVAREGRESGREITVPTLIIHAVNDRIIRHQGSKTFYRSLSGLAADQKRLILFPNGHHNLTVDLNPRKVDVFRWIDEFIGK